MKLDTILPGSRIFVDANIIVYALGRKSAQSRSFLARCESGLIDGWITTAVLAEVGHRRMMVEAQFRGLATSNPARALSHKRGLIRQLSIYAGEVRNLLEGGLEVDLIRPEDFLVALELQKQHGLLTNDALNLAAAQRLGLTEIATADSHFDHIAGLSVYKPDDLKI